MAHPSGLGPLTRPFAGYSDEERPLGSYLALVSTWHALFLGGLVAAERRRGLSERVGLGDVVLVGAATHKVCRLIAKDRVLSFLRAPFTRYQEDSGQGEVE